MRRQEDKENAVSPVIGVMLMLVITIIVAAVITGFATDLSKDAEKAPMALFEVQDIKIKESGEQKYLESFGLKHKGGDPILMKEVQITLEQVGGKSSNGIITVLPGAGEYDLMYGRTNYYLKVRGQEGKNSDGVATTGDVILVTQKADGSYNMIMKGSIAKWTLTYTKTNGLIASGEFLVQ